MMAIGVFIYPGDGGYPTDTVVSKSRCSPDPRLVSDGKVIAIMNHGHGNKKATVPCKDGFEAVSRLSGVCDF